MKPENHLQREMLPAGWPNRIQQLKMSEILKNLRNTTNRMITRERHERRKNQFQQAGVSNKNKWKIIKADTGQQQKRSPETIKEGQTLHTKPNDIANALNRQYIATVRNTIQKIPQTQTNPMEHYTAALGPVNTKLNICQLNMSHFRKILSNIASTTSTTADYLSMKVLKQAGQVIHPHLLHLVNSVISTENYPEALKITKIVPIPKMGKDQNLPEGWRPINLVPALSKVVEKFCWTR